MSEGLNRVLLIGHVGQPPDLRTTQNNQAVLSIRMATTEGHFDSNTKERKEKTEWHSCVLFGKRAEALSKFISKGSRICVEGRLQTRSWEDKTGAKRYSTEVVASNIILLGDKRTSERQEPRDDYGGAGVADTGMGDDDIPF